MIRRSKNSVMFFIYAAALITFSSCSSAMPKSTHDTVKSKKIIYIGSIAILTDITKLKADRTAKGVLRVNLNIANKTFAPRRNIWVEVMARFKDSSGFVLSTTEWHALMVSKDSELSYSIMSPDAHAEDFAVSIRKR